MRWRLSLAEDLAGRAPELAPSNWLWSVLPAWQMTASDWQSWDDLNASLTRSHPLLDSRFVEPLLRIFGSGDEWLVRAQDRSNLTAAALVRKRRSGMWESFLPSQAPLGACLAATAAHAKAISSHLPGTAWSLDLQCQDPLFAPVAAPFVRIRSTLSEYCQTMAVDVADGFEAYWQGRSRNLRSNMARYLRRAAKAGSAIELKHISAGNDLSAAVLRYADLESKGWKGQLGTAITPGNAQERFYSTVMERFSQNGMAEVYELHWADRLAASRLLIRNADFRIILKTTYDETLKELAPGRLLLHEMLAHAAHGSGPKRFEFYTKASADQLAWATEQRPIVHVQVFPRAWMRSIDQLVRKRLRRTVKSAREAEQATEATSPADGTR
jgi:Acetyltransferase (GNAT) domain